ncbi:glutamine-hydrolyzing GMP synthase [Candidatus Woesearchaeota archaeon]|nr:glutamine-hydrolyzing GMP synthase [Candidatus Woesearchaeota archaeon]
MDKIIVLDFGGQYAHLIANRIRRLGVYSEIRPANTKIFKPEEVKGIILSGGPQNISEDDNLKCDPEIFNLNIPVLGICYGHQLIAHILGGQVARGETREYGKAAINVKNKEKLFDNIKDLEIVWMSHGDYVSKLPKGFEITASTEDCETAAVANFEKNIYGLQFHPEVTHTKSGMKILENFIYNICNCKKSWDMKEFIKKEIEEIKQVVGNKKVFLLVSGGVDSSVCYALLNKALGPDNVYGLHVDNGFVRKNESKQVEESFRKIGFANFHVVDASQEFLNAVKEVYDPEQKRMVIGEKFITVQDAETKKLNLNQKDWILGQGTIYPDTIETAGTKDAALIKTHHNRVEAVQKLIVQGKVIEPIKDLYKDEVRRVGEMLGLPHEFVYRHPFPGPGLAVRCLCAQEEYEVENYTANVVSQIAEKYGLKSKVLPIKSVGVQGDVRTYAHPAVIIGDENWDSLEDVSTRITNEVSDVNRVVWHIAGKLNNPKIKKAYLTKERIDLLREADQIVSDYLHENNIYDDIWQFPTVLIPISFKGGESIVLRPVDSMEAMTASFSKLDVNHAKAIAEKILALKGIDAVFYDITNKPPGTIEWE